MRGLLHFAKLNNGKVDKTRVNPMPFPGKYPTRWMFTTENIFIPGQKFTYLGKPSAKAARRFYAICDKIGGAGRYTFVEFDRGGPISASDGAAHGRHALAAIGPLLTLYYPWAAMTHALLPWATEYVYHKRISHKGHMISCYSPYKNMDAEHQDKLRTFRQWLGNTRILLK